MPSHDIASAPVSGKRWLCTKLSTDARHRRHGQPRFSTLAIPVFRVTSWNFTTDQRYSSKCSRAVVKSCILLDHLHLYSSTKIRTDYAFRSSDLPRPRRSAQSAPAGWQPHSFEKLLCLIKIFPFLVPTPRLHLNCALRVHGFRFF